MNRNELRDELRSRLTDYVLKITEPDQRAGKDFYKCPLCKSGDHDTRGSDGAFHVTGEMWHCFACHQGGDIFELIRLHEHTTDFPETLHKGADILGLSVTDLSSLSRTVSQPVKKTAPQEAKHNPERRNKIEICAEKLSGSVAEKYLKDRGFSSETITHFKLGYECNENRVVIPYPGNDYATRRAIDPDAEKKYLYPKGEEMPLFVIHEGKPNLFAITEGQLDAVSLYQVGVKNVLAPGGGSNKVLEDFIDSMEIEGALIIADRDPEDKKGADGLTPGERTARRFKKVFSDRDITSLIVYPPEGYKDSNDVLKKDPELLRKLVVEWFKNLQTAIKTDEEASREPTSQEDFDAFLTEIATNRFEPIPTGIEQLDKALSGGLERKTLVTLAAAPGAGKTAIAQYILENMSVSGHNVVYVNLEMDRSQLLSRSIARLSHEYKVKNHKYIYEDVTALQVKRGYEWTDSQRKIVSERAAYYREKIAPHFRYVTTNKTDPTSIENNLRAIMDKLQKITAELIRDGQEAPIVCVDYLQFIGKDEESKKLDNADFIKKVLDELKNFALQHNTVVLVITANNRASNSEGRASMDSARDTSNIEYSGDVMLSLVYTAVEEHWLRRNGVDKSGNDKTSYVDNDFIHRVTDFTLSQNNGYPLIAKLLSLKVVKGRSIQSRGVAKFIYEGKYFYFEPDQGTENPYVTSSRAVAREQKEDELNMSPFIGADGQ